MHMLRICLSGLGRTGIQIARYLMDAQEVSLVSAICSPNSSKAGRDLGEVIGFKKTNIPIYSSNQIEPCIFITRPDVVIDFSTPIAALQNAEVFSKMGLNIVMGTTGFSQPQEKRLFSIVRKNKSGMIYAPNITKGVNTLIALAEFAAKILNSYDMEIVEMHHKQKRDIPSGTALKIADAMAETKDAIPMTERSEIPISSVRAGGIVGCHKVMLVGKYDMIEISHQSFSREAFAEGALYAAEFIRDKTGIYEMRDALNYDTVIAELLEHTSRVREHEKIPSAKEMVTLNR